MFVVICPTIFHHLGCKKLTDIAGVGQGLTWGSHFEDAPGSMFVLTSLERTKLGLKFRKLRGKGTGDKSVISDRGGGVEMPIVS